mgnify:CR=1 FL=1
MELGRVEAREDIVSRCFLNNDEDGGGVAKPWVVWWGVWMSCINELGPSYLSEMKCASCSYIRLAILVSMEMPISQSMEPMYTSLLDGCLLLNEGWLYFKAQSHMLGFIELKLDIFDQLQGKYIHDSFVKRYYMRTKSSKDSTKITNTLEDNVTFLMVNSIAMERFVFQISLK